jgi:hypothetical protein
VGRELVQAGEGFSIGWFDGENKLNEKALSDLSLTGVASLLERKIDRSAVPIFL